MGVTDAPGIPQALADKRYGRLGYRQSIFGGHAMIAGRTNPFCYNTSNLSGTTNTSGNFRYGHPVFVAATAVRLLYVNWYNGDTAGPNVISVKASLEWPGATVYSGNGQVGAKTPIYFRGARTVSIDPGGYALSDPVEMTTVVGQYLYSRTYVSVAAVGQQWPLDLYTIGNPNTEGQVVGAPATDYSDYSGGGISSATTMGYGPSGVLGTPLSGSRPLFVGLIGDSILYGSGDSQPNGLGFVVRALTAASIPYINVAVPGEQGSSRISNGLIFPGKRSLFTAACTHWIEEYGQNDRAAGGQTLAQIQTTRLTYWKDGYARGIKVFATTNTPNTTSTDTWKTITNQTQTSSEAIRQQLNAWLRDGAPLNSADLSIAATGATGNVIRAGTASHPLAGVFDTAAQVEVNATGTITLNGGYWNVNGTANAYTVDGTHPSATGHTAMAAGVITTKLV